MSDEQQKTGFLEEAPGVALAGRLALHIIIAAGVLTVLSTLAVGLWGYVHDAHRELAQLLSLAQAIGLEFTGSVIPGATLHIGGKIAERTQP